MSAVGVIQAMRSTRPGAWEHQLDAVMRYTYLVNGARDAVLGHHRQRRQHPLSDYRANNAELIDGDLVLVDCAPDYHYYTSDIARMWPVNGRYSAVQRELYGFVVAYHKAFLDLIRPGVTVEQITAEAAERMRGVVEATRGRNRSTSRARATP